MKPKNKKQAPVVLKCGFIKSTIIFTPDCNQDNILHKEFNYDTMTNYLNNRTVTSDVQNMQNMDKSSFLS